MKHQIKYGTTIEELEILIQESISDGWTPQGGICVVVNDGVHSFYQVFVML